jgi:hypothetical protein
MLDPTPSRNLKDRPSGTATLLRMAGRVRTPSGFRNAFVVLALFLAATAVWTGGNWLLYPPAPPKAALRDTDNRAHIAHIDAGVKEILDRPLFSGDRSPPPPPPTPEQLALLHRPVLKSHLTGITVLTDTRVALFAGEANKYVSVKEGEEIDGFKVKNILPDRVILASAFGEQTVSISKGPVQTVRNTKPVDLGSFDPDRHNQ